MSVIESKTYSDSFDVVNFALAISRDSSVTANTNFSGGTYRPRRRPCVLRVTACFQTACVFSAILNDGVARTHTFNEGAQLLANNVYTFDLVIGGVTDEATVDWQSDVNNTISSFHVEEIDQAA